MIEIYLVQQSAGRYDDYSTWTVRALRNLEAAQNWATNANLKLDEENAKMKAEAEEYDKLYRALEEEFDFDYDNELLNDKARQFDTEWYLAGKCNEYRRFNGYVAVHAPIILE